VTSVASAPGKIVLCGEYAVLDGAPAICMAVNRRARAAVSRTDSRHHTVRTSGHIEGEWQFRVAEDGMLEWADNGSPADGLKLLREAMRSIDASDALEIGLDTTAFFDTGSKQKLGLGSSAALTAALVSALYDVTRNPGDVVTESIAAHRRLQHGRGSGADIATSMNGGLIDYSTADSGTCRPLQWPDGLEYAVLWSGRPANTSQKLQKLGQYPGSSASAATLRAASEAVAEIWPAGSVADLLDGLARYTDALMQFDVDHGLGIFDAGHRELTELAAKQNLLYKPCGAGGGDIGMVFATDERAFPDFVGNAAGIGFQSLDVSLEMDGVRLGS
jgi:phosphomevalonate kinase